jgi:acetyl esterase
MYLIDPELSAHLGELDATDMSNVEAAREQLRATAARARRPAGEEPVTVRDIRVPGQAGRPAVRVRIYAPSPSAGLQGGLFYLHGGGFALGDLEMADAACRGYAAAAQIVVVSVEYRLAPEHPFPAGLQDCYAALRWMAERGAELGVDPARIAVMGESAGGGLAASLALLARDRGGPQICFQLLEIPVLDDRLSSASMRAFTDTPVWDRANAERSWRLYLGHDVAPGDPDVSPYAAPARAGDLSGLPRTCIVVAEFDPLRDEGMAYAHRLLTAGVSTELFVYAGTFHGSTMFADAAVSKRMWRDTVDALRRGLAERPAGRPATTITEPPPIDQENPT